MSLKLNFFNAPVYTCREISSNPGYKGKNAKGILIICNNSDNVEIADFLKKIMGAVNSDLENDAAIFDLKTDTEISWSTLIKNNKHEKVIFFGIEPAQIGLHLKLVKYQLLNWNGIKLLFSDSLEQILADKNKKGFLWRELQLMFGKV